MLVPAPRAWIDFAEIHGGASCLIEPDPQAHVHPCHLGVMIAPERVVPDSLIVAKDRNLPPLPDLRAGVYCKEGFDIKHNKSLVDAFLTAVRPPLATPKQPTRRP